MPEEVATPTTEIAPELAAKIAEMTDSDLYMPASNEHKAARAAKQAGEPRPPTPHLDEMHRRHEGGVTVKKSKSGTPREPKVEMKYFRNGQPMPASQNSISSLAYQATKDIKRDAQRVSTDALIKILVDAGVKNPKSESFDVELSNGNTISGRVPGDKSAVIKPAAKAAPVKNAAPVKKATTKKSVAKKAPAKKAAAKKATPAKKSAPRKTSTAKKSPAKKATASKSVTPRFKK